MSWLFEANPYVVLACGAAALATFLTAMFRTGQRRYLALTIAAVLLTGLVLLVEWAIETPREEVERTLRTIAAELEANDDAAVLAYISPSRPDLSLVAAAELRKVELDEVKIAQNLEIMVEPERGVAEASFNARFQGSYGGYGEGSGVQHFRVIFRKEADGQWRIRDYEMSKVEF